MTWKAEIIPTDQINDRDDWLHKRRSGIGASDVAGIVGLSPWSTPYTVWADKTDRIDDDEPNEQMRWGSKLEGVITDEFVERTGLFVGDAQVLVMDPIKKWPRATLDGVVYEYPHTEGNEVDRRVSALGLLEVKTDAKFGRWKEVPDHYQTQVQWQMWVTGLEHAWIACLHGGSQFEIYEEPANHKIQGLLAIRAERFLEEHVWPDVAPPVDASEVTTKVLSDLWTPQDDTEVELGDEVAAALEAIPPLKAQIKEIESLVRGYENRVKQALGEQTVGLVGGVPAVTWKGGPRKGYYVEPKEMVRRFTIKKRKDK